MHHAETHAPAMRSGLRLVALALLLAVVPLLLPPADALAATHGAADGSATAVLASDAGSSGSGSAIGGGGGTFIVLILVAIGAAIAIPVFLGQKQKASSSAAKQDAKAVADTIESCGASTTTGHVREGALHCATKAEVIREEPSLAPVLASSCTELPTGKTCVQDIGPDEYEVTSSTAATGNDAAVFIYHRDASSVKRTCGPSGAPGCAAGTW